MPTIPASEIKTRIACLQNRLRQEKLSMAFMLQAADIFYYAGVFQQGVLWVPDEGEPIFFVRRSFDEARRFSPLSQVVAIKSPRQIPALPQAKQVQWEGCAGIESDVLPVQQYEMLKETFPTLTFHNCSPLIREQRAVKSDFELAIQRRGAAIMDAAYQQLGKEIRPGMSELEISARFEYLIRIEGHQVAVRVRGLNPEFHYGSMLAGNSGTVVSFFDGALGGAGLSPAFPIGSSRSIWNKNEPLMVDYVGSFDGYCVDTSRVFVAGELAGQLQLAHQVALDIIKALQNKARPGVTCEEAYALSCEIAQSAGLAKHFMGYGDTQAKFVGHGVGIELNELPVLARGNQTCLVRNMVLAIEPKLVFPALGAVGTESTFVVRDDGLEPLDVCDNRLLHV
jgi:Xaa-Pro aminopeptidase